MHTTGLFIKRNWIQFALLAFAFLGLAPRGSAQNISCSSDDMRRHYCQVDTSGGVRLANQRSEAACREGYSWGYDRTGIWVDHGCRADFSVGSYQGGLGYPGGSNSGAITCSSDDMRRHYCQADTNGGVRLLKQRSEAACTEGYSWGFDRSGIWVDHGCRADFMVNPSTFDSGYPRGSNSGSTITCSSDDMHRHYCQVDTSGGVRLLNQRSGSACREGYSWGYDRNGIWVDHGCRADFTIVSSRYDPRRRGPRDQVGTTSTTITCSSDDMRKHYCQADTRGGVRLLNQRSGSACREGYSWGYDSNGIWVDKGCRADFEVRR